MEIPVVKIGNSKGIRIPKTVLKQLKIEDSLEMEVHETELRLKPVKANPRAGWKKSFKEMSDRKDDRLILPDFADDEDFQWQW